MDAVSGAIIDLVLSNKEQLPQLVNVVHPKPISWHSLAGLLATKLSLQMIPYEDWLAKLEDECERNSSLNAAHLLPFFRNIAVSQPEADREGFGLPWLDTKECVTACPSLNEVQQLGEDDVKRWLTYWKQVGLLEE